MGTQTAVPMPQQAPKMEELLARIAELEGKLQAGERTALKITDKGGISVYGIQRFPVTLYAFGWISILKKRDTLLKFIRANFDSLTFTTPEQKVDVDAQLKLLGF